jgi:hypothetical protein
MIDHDNTLTGRRHPQTSVLAAARAMGRTGSGRRRVIEALAEADRTDEELQHDLRMAANTERPRRVELTAWGFVEATGLRRPGVSGAQSIVWTVTEFGRLALGLTED